MLNPNPKLDNVRECYGKKWGASDPDCVGSRTSQPCAIQDSCRLEIAHGLVSPRRLTQGPSPAPVWPVHTPPGPRPVATPFTAPPAATPEPLRTYSPHATPLPSPLPVNAPNAHTFHGGVPLEVRGATLIPHATHAPATLSVPESRAPGRKVASFFLELLRAGAKGSAIQASNFFDEVPIDPFDPRGRK